MKLETLLAVEPSPTRVALDLGCGLSPKSGFTGVDLFAPSVDKRIDLLKFPLPWDDNSVDEIWCSHLLEYIPNRDVESRDLVDDSGTNVVGEDMCYAFMDECWRILKPSAIMTVVVANARCTRAFCDPAVRRRFVAESFFYFSAQWRKENGCGFYPARCDFNPGITPIVRRELTLRAQEHQMAVCDTQWNAILDWQVTLMAQKASRAGT